MCNIYCAAIFTYHIRHNSFRTNLKNISTNLAHLEIILTLKSSKILRHLVCVYLDQSWFQALYSKLSVWIRNSSIPVPSCSAVRFLLSTHRDIIDCDIIARLVCYDVSYLGTTGTVTTSAAQSTQLRPGGVVCAGLGQRWWWMIFFPQHCSKPAMSDRARDSTVRGKEGQQSHLSNDPLTSITNGNLLCFRFQRIRIGESS